MNMLIHSIHLLKSLFVWGTEPRVHFLGQIRILIPENKNFFLFLMVIILIIMETAETKFTWRLWLNKEHLNIYLHYVSYAFWFLFLFSSVKSRKLLREVEIEEAILVPSLNFINKGHYNISIGWHCVRIIIFVVI